MMVVILFRQMNGSLANTLLLFCGAVMIAAHVLYFISLGKILYERSKK